MSFKKNIDKDAIMQVNKKPDLVFTHGKGSWIFDHHEKKYFDCIQGWAVNCFGHSHSKIVQALNKQAKKVINVSPSFYNDPMIYLANLLKKYSCFDKVFFANSGAEANEGAIKLARKWGKLYKSGAYEIITFKNSFHGRTLLTMSASGKVGWDVMFGPQVPGFPKANFNDINSVQSLINKNTVAVMIEPIQGEAGVIPADYKFMQQLYQCIKKNKLLLIVDEVQVGCGRTGSLFAYQLYDIFPDIMTLGKGIGGGVPLSALLAKKDVACFEYGEQGGTYNGNPLMTAVGCMVIEKLVSPGFLNAVYKKGIYLNNALLKIVRDFNLQDERGVGLLRALKFGKNIADKVVEKSRELEPIGLLLNSPGPDLLRFMPALNIKYKELDQMIELLNIAISIIYKKL